jgi:hypothetical protein
MPVPVLSENSVRPGFASQGRFIASLAMFAIMHAFGMFVRFRSLEREGADCVGFGRTHLQISLVLWLALLNGGSRLGVYRGNRFPRPLRRDDSANLKGYAGSPLMPGHCQRVYHCHWTRVTEALSEPNTAPLRLADLGSAEIRGSATVRSGHGQAKRNRASS